MHPADDGTLSLGSFRELAIADEPDDPAVPRAILRRAIRFVPAIADAPVLSSWWGVRPMSPDDRPLVEPLREGLVIATDGAEGVPRCGHGVVGAVHGGGRGAAARPDAVRPRALRLGTPVVRTRFGQGEASRPWRSSSSSVRSIGRACRTFPARPRVVVDMNRAFTTASSTASTVMANSDEKTAGDRSPGPSSRARTSIDGSEESASTLPVEKATICSPDPLPAVDPVLARPSPARPPGAEPDAGAWAHRSRPPRCTSLRGFSGMRSVSSGPTWTPSIRSSARSPKFVSTSAPTV